MERRVGIDRGLSRDGEVLPSILDVVVHFVAVSQAVRNRAVNLLQGQNWKRLGARLGGPTGML